MIRKSLVTTAIESTWPKEGPLIFLGSWCCSFSRREKLSSLDFEIVPYHWDDRNKLFQDYKNLELIYEAYLSECASKLNDIHKTNFSKRFWRILIGPWLYTAIQVVFDRWYMLDKIMKNEEKMQMLSMNNEFTTLVTNDLNSFNNAIETDEWNEALYSVLINFLFKSQVNINYVEESKHQKNVINNNSNPNTFNLKIKKLCNKLSSLLSNNKSIFIISPHISFARQIFLSIRLGQFPTLWFKSENDFSYSNHPKLREAINLKCAPGIVNDFEAVLNKILFRIIPRIYLEGFESLHESTRSNGWPKSPKSIFTSNSYSSDEVFKFWAGSKVDNGSKLIIGQHGGNFGMTPMAIHETHQIKISDKWLSWGWSDDSEAKIIPIGNFKFRQTKIKNKSDGDALLVAMTLPKFSYYLYSVPIAGQVGEYFNDQLEFFEALPDYIKQKFRVRLYPVDRDWAQMDRWQSKYNQIRFDDRKKSLMESLRTSRIFIGTYNATTYLETFNANMPSILFWNANHWEVNDKTMNYFNQLIEAGVLHYSPKSAAEHLINIWDNIDEWWFSDSVQDVITDFNNHYSNQSANVVSSIANNLKSL